MPEWSSVVALLAALSGATGQEWHYTATASVRLGPFWISRENVGWASLRTGSDAQGKDFIRIVMGSDPHRAPFRINRWGAMTELMDHSRTQSLVFGLMKPSQSGSPLAARRDVENSRQAPLFQAIIGSTGSSRTASLAATLVLDRDFTARESEAAERSVLAMLSASSAGAPRIVPPSARPDCARSAGFLFTVRALLETALSDQHAEAGECFWYNGKRYTVRLKRHARRADLLRAEFEVLNHASRERSRFTILAAASGARRGVPVEIEYAPNWWFKVVLKLAVRLTNSWKEHLC
jgi:hypothetical protein